MRHTFNLIEAVENVDEILMRWYNEDTVKKILENTFLDDGNLDSYIKVIMEESKKNNLNPYYIAVKIIQEQGTKGGSTFKIPTNVNSSDTGLYSEPS